MRQIIQVTCLVSREQNSDHTFEKMGNENKGIKGQGHTLGTKQSTNGQASTYTSDAPSYGGQYGAQQAAQSTSEDARQREARAAAASQRVTHKKAQKRDPMKTKAEHFKRYSAIEKGEVQPKMEPRIEGGVIKPKTPLSSKKTPAPSRDVNPLQTAEEQQRRIRMGELAASRAPKPITSEERKQKQLKTKDENHKRYTSLGADSSPARPSPMQIPSDAVCQAEKSATTTEEADSKEEEEEENSEESEERAMVVEALTDLFQSHPAAYKMIRKILQNLVAAPDSPEGDKFRKLKLSNPKIKQTIVDADNALPLLLMFGWEQRQLPTKNGGSEAFLLYSNPNAKRVPQMVLSGMAEFEAEYMSSVSSSSSSAAPPSPSPSSVSSVPDSSSGFDPNDPLAFLDS
eukprot:gb/GEZN01007025.1/.p1 GENE.gb/GEZN01007025.1/~~gb/GEZN01007025.1/.p1  ORF type:complete len:401 (+),score=89.20 gb/GEZN01007025.1/:172-1374(+)